jgi:hypothetical protein
MKTLYFLLLAILSAASTGEAVTVFTGARVIDGALGSEQNR